MIQSIETKRPFTFKFLFCVSFACLFFSLTGWANENTKPTRLMVNLIAHSDWVFLNGYLVNTPLYQAIERKENFQFVEIGQKQPFFGWTVNSGKNNTLQTAYQILVSSSLETIQHEEGDMWDSGKTESDQSINVRFTDRPLKPNTVYFWKVKTWNNHGEESSYSDIMQFKTAATLVDYATARYPIQKQDDYAILIKPLSASHTFVDFGKAAFGRVRVKLLGKSETDTVIVHLGEAKKEDKIDRNPGGTIRYAAYKLALRRGWNTYTICISPDKLNTGPDAVLMPTYIGEVLPFRYCEIENYSETLGNESLVRETVYYPFGEEDAYFTSSNEVLNQVWELCKYSIKATSFAGVYVDGDRERIPYEADALINQLGHYNVACEYSIARYSHEYLIHKPTWPTEWILQSLLMAWYDYLYTGNKESLEHFYNDLKAKSLIALADKNGFISTRTSKVTPEVLQSIHLNGQLLDIVDWPHTGILGLKENEGGETDGFVFQDVNTVVNAYHYRALVILSQIAELLSKNNDRQMFSLQAEKLKKSFNQKLFNSRKGFYVDGIGTDHASLHSNMFPLAFGLVPKKNIKKITNFLRTRGMACSVYGSQFLLDALYDGHDAEYGLELLASTSERSWYNMIRVGSTISLEAWDNRYKPNLDWNHVWGAAPANLIPRKLMGIEPLEPGFRKIQIKPQPASLEKAEINLPTIRGDILVSFLNKPGEYFRLNISIPANTKAEVYLPLTFKNQVVSMNGNPISFQVEGNFAVIDNVGSGHNIFEVSHKNL